MKHDDLRMRHDALADSSIMQELCLSVAEEFDRLAEPVHSAKKTPRPGRTVEKVRRTPGTSAASAVGQLFSWRRSRLAR